MQTSAIEKKVDAYTNLLLQKIKLLIDEQQEIKQEINEIDNRLIRLNAKLFPEIDYDL